MQPLLNLKSFLATLLILAVPGALLVAYFRNYSPEAGGHEHAAGHGSHGDKDHEMESGKKMSGDMSSKSHDDMSSGHKHDMPESMDHDNMKSATPAQPPMEESGPPAVLHIGAKGFFLDLPQTFTPRADQAKMLTDIKERTAMEMMTAEKKIQESEKQLWKLTANDRPDLAGIESKTREVERLRADQRISFIRAVAEAASLLTTEQKETLLRVDSSAITDGNAPAAPDAKADQKSEPAHKH